MSLNCSTKTRTNNALQKLSNYVFRPSNATNKPKQMLLKTANSHPNEGMRIKFNIEER